MLLEDALRSRLGEALARGGAPSRLGVALASAWAAAGARTLRRPLALPRGAAVIGVGSAVLGGAGKTPVAIGLAAELARRGHAVALVGHAYRARPGHARVVTAGDSVESVGDDAAYAARALAAEGVPVVVAPSRQAATDLAASIARVLVVDGLLATRPERLTASVLVLDALRPWGAGSCPPLGDLRASRAAILDATDCVAWVTDAAAAPGFGARRPGEDAPAAWVAVESRVDAAQGGDGRPVPLAELAGLRLGLLVGVARPDRVVAALGLRGIVPAPVVTLADHARFSAPAVAPARDASVDAWLTTARCAVKLPRALGGAPVLALEHSLDVAPLASRVEALVRSPAAK